MGRLNDAAAMVHTGIRATKSGHESNFICSPIAILSVFFVAMRGARGPTHHEMQAFIGISKLPPLPPHPPLPGPDSEGISSSSQSESEGPRPSWTSPLTWLRQVRQRYSKGASGRKASDSSSEEGGRGDVVFRIATRMYVSTETAATKAFQEYEKDVKRGTRGRADARELNFREGDTAEKAVNEFVAEETENHIQNLLPSGSITAQTRLLAVCAAFFKGKWKTTFNVHLTEKRPFYAVEHGEFGTTSAEQKEEEKAEAEGATREAEEKESDSPPTGASSSAVQLGVQQVSMMFVQIEKPPFFVQKTEKYTAVGLPYQDTRYVLFVVMPHTAAKLPLLTIPLNKRQELGFDDMEFPYVEDIVAHMKTMAAERKKVQMYIHLPKFHLKAENNRADLGAVFKDKLGVTSPFVPGQADFGGIDGGSEDLFINLFAHAAEIQVDEKGTVATGAAALSIAARSLGPRPDETFELEFNRPFFFQLRYLAQKPKEIWSDEDTDTEGAGEVGGTRQKRRSKTKGAAAAAAEAAPRDDPEHQDLVLFSGNIVDAAAAQS